MQTYIPRQLEADLRDSLGTNPVTAVLGPRQAGKSTLVRHSLAGQGNALILDLDLPSDLRRLTDPELFLREHADRLVCIDEIQLKPDLFPLLRALVDMDRRPGRFVILPGSTPAIPLDGTRIDRIPGPVTRVSVWGHPSIKTLRKSGNLAGRP